MVKKSENTRNLLKFFTISLNISFEVKIFIKKIVVSQPEKKPWVILTKHTLLIDLSK